MLCLPLGGFAQEDQSPSNRTNTVNGELKSSSTSSFDVNGDNIVSIQDAALVIAYLKGDLPEGNTYNCDVNNDGKVSVADIKAIVDKILNLVATIPVGGSNDDPDAPGTASSKETILTEE